MDSISSSINSISSSIIDAVSSSMVSSVIVGSKDEVAELAKDNPCLVQGTKTEFYDCCTKEGEKLCLGMGIANSVLLV
jgi:hypothetical protein